MMLLKLADVFRRLRVSPATGYRLLRDGVIPVVVLRRGSRRRLLRVREEDLERALQAGAPGKATESKRRLDPWKRGNEQRSRRRRVRRTPGEVT